MNARHALWTLAAMLLLGLSACGGSSATEEATPDLSRLPVADQTLVRFEAQWLCDVQRHAFADLSDMEVARGELMSAFGVAATAYDDFKTRIQTDESMRAHVSAAFLSTCASTGGTT